MRTRLARIVAKLAIASTTAQNSETLQPTSSVGSVEMLVTWERIAQTDNVVQPIGKVLVGHLALQVVLVLGMRLTESMSNSCKNSLAVHLLTLLDVLNLVLVVTSRGLLLAMMSSHGNVVLLVPQLLGNNVAAEMIVGGMNPVTPVQLEEPRLGHEIVVAETTVVTLTMEVRTAMAHRLHPLLHLGNKQPPIRQVDIRATLHLDMALDTKEAWAHLLVLLLLRG